MATDTIYPGSSSSRAKEGRYLGFTDLIPITDRLILLDSSQRLRKMEALFNPNRLGLSIRVASGSLNPVGSSHPVQQYHHTEAVTFPLELYWSAIAMHKFEYASEQGRDLNKVVAWFASFCFPLAKGVAPPPLLIVWPNTLTMLTIVKGFKVQYTHWDTYGNPRILKITLQLNELRQASRYHWDMAANKGGFATSDEYHSASGIGAGFNPGQRGRGAKVGGRK